MRSFLAGLSLLAACTPMHANTAALSRCASWRVEVRNGSRDAVDVVTKDGVLGSVAAGADAEFIVPGGTTVSTRVMLGAAGTTAGTRQLTGVTPSEASPRGGQVRAFYDCDTPK
jgi:hypothetical protein